MSGRHKTIPEFTSEAEGRAFLEKHDSSEYLDWTKAQRAIFPNLKPTTRTISLRLPQHLLDSIKPQPTLAMCPISRSSRCGCRRSCIAI